MKTGRASLRILPRTVTWHAQRGESKLVSFENGAISLVGSVEGPFGNQIGLFWKDVVLETHLFLFIIPKIKVLEVS
jgi:hypothetical protein